MRQTREITIQSPRMRGVIKQSPAVVLILAFACMAMNLLAQGCLSYSHVEPWSGVRGLEGVDLDSWTKGFFERRSIEQSVDPEKLIVDAFRSALSDPQASWLQRFYGPLLQLSRPLASTAAYLALVRSILSARNEIRTALPVDRARQALFLLSLLSDEALYAMTLQFPDHPVQEWAWLRDKKDPECHELYRKQLLCPGDVVISKSDAFSSFLFMFRTPLASTFSHASLAYRDPEKKRLMFLEADSLEKPWQEATSLDHEPKVSIYRYRGGGDRPEKAVKQLIEFPHAFDFNFRLLPDCVKDRYFCSELVYCGYGDAGLVGEENPYPRGLWAASRPEDKVVVDEFFGPITNIYWGAIPAPGDIELNPRYEPIGHWVRVDRIAELRARHLLVDALISLMHDEPALREQYLSALAWFAQSKDRIVSLLSSFSTGRAIAQHLARFDEQSRGKVDPKSLVFYAHLDQVIIPRALQEQVRGAKSEPQVYSVLHDRMTALIRSQIRLLFYISRVGRLFI